VCRILGCGSFDSILLLLGTILVIMGGQSGSFIPESNKFAPLDLSRNARSNLDFLAGRLERIHLPLVTRTANSLALMGQVAVRVRVIIYDIVLKLTWSGTRKLKGPYHSLYGQPYYVLCSDCSQLVIDIAYCLIFITYDLLSTAYCPVSTACCLVRPLFLRTSVIITT
jgi:hypothetical protein